MFNIHQYKKKIKDQKHFEKNKIAETKEKLDHLILNEELAFHYNTRVKKFLFKVVNNPIEMSESKPKEEKSNVKDNSIVSVLKFKINDLENRSNYALNKISEKAKFSDAYYNEGLERLRLEKEAKLKAEQDKKKNLQLRNQMMKQAETNASLLNGHNSMINNTKESFSKGNKSKSKSLEFCYSTASLLTSEPKHTYFNGLKKIAYCTTDALEKINRERFLSVRQMKIEEAKQLQPALSHEYLLKYASPQRQRSLRKSGNFSPYRQTLDIRKKILELKQTIPEVTSHNPMLMELREEYYRHETDLMSSEFDKEKFTEQNIRKIRGMIENKRETYYDKLFKSSKLKMKGFVESKNSNRTILSTDPKKYFEVIKGIEMPQKEKGLDYVNIDGKYYKYNELKQISKKVLKKCNLLP